LAMAVLATITAYGLGILVPVAAHGDEAMQGVSRQQFAGPGAGANHDGQTGIQQSL